MTQVSLWIGRRGPKPCERLQNVPRRRRNPRPCKWGSEHKPVAELQSTVEQCIHAVQVLLQLELQQQPRSQSVFPGAMPELQRTVQGPGAEGLLLEFGAIL